MRKSNPIRRSVHSVHPEREKGDAPTRIGRLAKIRLWIWPLFHPGFFFGRPVPEGLEGSNRLANRWTMLIAVVALLSLGFMIWKGMAHTSDPIEAHQAVPVGRTDGEIRVRSAHVSLTEEEAIALVKAAVESRDAGTVGKYFRSGDATVNEIVRFLKEMEATDGKVDGYEWMGSIDANGMAMDGVIITFNNPGAPRNRLAALVPGEDGAWRVDFPAFARSVDPAWDKIISGEAKHATVRVHVAADNYYNGVFGDEGKWVSASLASPDTPEVLIGYCTMESPQGAALKRIVSKGAPLSRAVLEIRRVEGGEPRQVLISRVYAEDWVMGDKAFDEVFSQ